jgi:hypothetical protein
MSERWTDELLDRMRGIADDGMDPAMERHYAEGGKAFLAAIRPFLDDWTAPLTPAVPPDLAELFLRPVQYPDWVDPEKIATVETLFLRYGPVALVVLILNGFPRAMTNRAIATAIDSAKLFNPLVVRRRMREVIQFTLNTSRRAGLQQPYWSRDHIHKNIGVWSGHKLRLKHCRVRLHVASMKPPIWDYEKYGKVINQEDLAETMLHFCLGIVEGLPKAGIVQSPQEQEAMLNMWKTIGFLLSLRPELLPENVADAKALREKIFRRTAQKSPEGVRVIEDLLRTADDLLPWFLHGSSAAFMRHQLGPEISAMLEIPKSWFWTFFLKITAPFWGVNGPFAKLAKFISPYLVRWLMKEEEGAGCQHQDPDAQVILGMDPRKV